MVGMDGRDDRGGGTGALKRKKCQLLVDIRSGIHTESGQTSGWGFRAAESRVCRERDILDNCR